MLFFLSSQTVILRTSSPQITAVGCLHQENHAWEDRTSLNLPQIRKITASEVPFTGWQPQGSVRLKKKFLPLEGQTAGGQSAGAGPRAFCTLAPARYPPGPPTVPYRFAGLPKAGCGDYKEPPKACSPPAAPAVPKSLMSQRGREGGKEIPPRSATPPARPTRPLSGSLPCSLRCRPRHPQLCRARWPRRLRARDSRQGHGAG